MKYENLQDLLRHSASSRSFIVSLPVKKQLILHDEFNGAIHNAAELHRIAASLDRHIRQLEISNSLDNYFRF